MFFGDVPELPSSGNVGGGGGGGGCPSDWELDNIADQCPELLNKVPWTVARLHTTT